MSIQAEPILRKRIQSIDILRGAIMLIMALDHTRDFFHIAGAYSDPTDMATTTPMLFFTRWITHFCAPTFVFLSGVSAYLAGIKRSKSELAGFLIKRGIWLIVVEIAVISLAFTLNPFYNFIALQVLWAIGFSMVILGVLVAARLSATTIGVIGALIFFGHDILDYIQLPKAGLSYDLWKIFFTAKGTVLRMSSGHFAFDLYAVIPWAGVMMVGYSSGKLYNASFNPLKRKKILLYTGITTLIFFVVFRIFNIYGDPAPWQVQRNDVFTVLSFFNVSKYPPSLMYLCMTIGASITILSLIEDVQSKFTAILTIYGNVPFFYYILHFYLIRLFTVIAFFALGFKTNQIIDPNNPFLFQPKGFGFNLGIVYLVWLSVITILYFPCRWFSKYKKTHHQWWLSYL